MQNANVVADPFKDIIREGPIPIRFPRDSSLAQDQEWCEVLLDGEWQSIRFHDYGKIYDIPGLYETIFYRTLRCISPTEVISLFRTMLLERGEDPETLSALDLGAGNGMAGEALQTLGIRRIWGVDILPEARAAAKRDRPWVYSDYLVTDMTSVAEPVRRELEAARLNTLVTVAALGFGDIPVRAFYNAFNLIQDPGWVSFNIKEDFLQDTDRGGFAGLISRLRQRGILRVEMYKRYKHRLNIQGKPLFYIALVARKLKDIPPALLAQVERV